MNIAVIERMVGQGDLSLDALRYLLSCRAECEWLDYKQELHLETDASAALFTRDVLAMKNVGGGYLVVGVEDKTWKPVGLKARLQFDSKLLRDQVRKCSGLDLDVDIVHHEQLSNAGTGLYALVFVRGSRNRRKRRTPSLVAKDFHPNDKFGLRKGEIWLRRGDSSVRIESESELQDLLESLSEAANQSAIESDQPSLPFAVLDGTYRLLEKGYGAFVGRNSLREAVIEAITRDPRIWIIDVHGPGGVGKSALVNWAVYQAYEKKSFEAILHLSAKDTILTDGGIKPSARSLYSLENLLDHILSLFEEEAKDQLEEKRKCAIELLDSWHTLLVLDNMETVQDGRILKFVQELPSTTKCKVLLTSRHKTGGWELPIPVSELSLDETTEFVSVKSQEFSVTFPLDADVIAKVKDQTGGLPLAIQWTIGRYKVTGDLTAVLEAVVNRDSPILEFSFRNIWNLLSSDAKACLAILTIFDSPPEMQQLSIATEWDLERIDKSIFELTEVTLVTASTQSSDGKIVYVALPITLSFARHQLSNMGDFEIKCRRRVQKFQQQMELRDWEAQNFTTVFQKFAITSMNEKRAAILCRRAESEAFSGNSENSDLLFLQARQTAPNSAYVLALGASGELVNGRVGQALDLIKHAESRVTKKTGALVYSIAARIADTQGDKAGRVGALEKAISYEPDNLILRHQYGVALSRAGRTAEAIGQFSEIIAAEEKRPIPTDTLIIALQTRIINLHRINKRDEANADLQRAKDIARKHPHLQSLIKAVDDLTD